MEIKNNQNKDIKEQLLEQITKNPADEKNYEELSKIYIAESKL